VFLSIRTKIGAIDNGFGANWISWSSFVGATCIPVVTAVAMVLRLLATPSTGLFLYQLQQDAICWCIVAVCHVVYVLLTFRGSPERTGIREVPLSRRGGALVGHISDTLYDYFQGRIVSEEELRSDGLYVMGFHPHGVMPLTPFWMLNCSEWRRSFPGVVVSPLTAYACHVVPVIRDLAQWMGCRDVSRESFKQALREGRSCLVVPGGQAEMLESKSTIDDIIVHTKHRGFIRLAMQAGAELVPVLSFGEVDVMDNISCPSVQQWFLQHVGIAFPHSPYGAWGLPIPRRRRITVVIGKSIKIPHISDPTNDDVKRVWIARCTFCG